MTYRSLVRFPALHFISRCDSISMGVWSIIYIFSAILQDRGEYITVVCYIFSATVCYIFSYRIAENI